MTQRESLKKQLLQRFLEWAGLQADIRAVALVGSAARVDHPADEWSDYDLVAVASDPQAYLCSTDWLGAMGSPWASILESTPAGEPIERRVLFEGGLDIDFIIVSTEIARQGFQHAPMVLEIMQRGVRVLLDQENVLSRLPGSPIPAHTAPAPSVQAFLAVVNDFWFHAAWTAKKLRRGELWVAKSCCDHYLKGLLLRMMEWEARAANGWEFNTWFNGRFLEAWALPQTLEELPQVFAHYDAEEVWQALQATMKMFGRMARETARRLAYPYPVDSDERVSTWVTQIHAGDSEGG